MKLVRWKDSRELFWADDEEQIAVKGYEEEAEGARPSSESKAMDIEIPSWPTEGDEEADDRRESIFVQGDIF